MRLARLVLTSAAAGAIALFAGTALAQNICLQLEAALVNLDRGATGSPADFARYDEAVRKQRNEIQRAMAEARRANCIGGFLFFREKPAPKCGALMAMIDRMQANLARLESRRDQYAYRPGGSRWEKDRILQALARNNCGPQYAGYARRNTLMGSIFPGSSSRRARSISAPTGRSACEPATATTSRSASRPWPRNSPATSRNARRCAPAWT
jgi:hypothetical protein